MSFREIFVLCESSQVCEYIHIEGRDVTPDAETGASVPCVLAVTASWSARVYAVARETHGRCVLFVRAVSMMSTNSSPHQGFSALIRNFLAHVRPKCPGVGPQLLRRPAVGARRGAGSTGGAMCAVVALTHIHMVCRATKDYVAIEPKLTAGGGRYKNRRAA